MEAVSSRGKKRLGVVDAVRGINFISMVLYHAMYDIVWIFDRGGSHPLYKGMQGHIWQQAIAMTFIVLSGFSTQLGSKNPKRGITVFLCGAAVSLATVIFYPSETIKYGVLTFMGAAMLVTLALDKVLRLVHPYIGMAASFILFAVTRNIDMGYIGVGANKAVLPSALYKTKLLAGFGFPYSGFTSSDYFPLFPWLFLFLFGYFLAVPILKSRRITDFLEHDGGFAAVIGRHTLILYMIHQPVIFGLLSLWFAFVQSL